MRKPPTTLVVAVMIPFLTGCMGITTQPVPPPTERAGLDVRGVVLDEESGERVRFREVSQVEWSDSTLAILGLQEGAARESEFVMDSWRLSEVEAILVHGVDANVTSLLLGGILLGSIVVVAFLINGQTTDDTVF